MKHLSAIIGIFFSLTYAQLALADSHAGYYYPAITSSEVFDRNINNPPKASKAVRVNFITDSTVSMLAAPYPPRFAVFAKGSRAQKLIIVALDDQVFKTLFRARGVLAQMTANARNTKFFKQNGLAINATFLDLAKMMDFDSVTISDGQNWSHQITFE